MFLKIVVIVSGFSIISATIFNEIQNFYTLQTKSLSSDCQNQVKLYLKGLRNDEPWALQMFDSSSKLQSGLLLGNLIDFGSFDECLAVQSESIFGKYCMVSIIPNNATINRYAGAMKLPPNRIMDMSVRREYGISWSLCIPNLCKPDDLQKHLEVEIPKLMDLDVRVQVNEKDCITSEDYRNRRFTTSDWMAILFFLVVTMVNTLCTIYDMVSNIIGNENRKEIILTFSFYDNIKKLLKVDENSMGVLDGLRFLSCIWIILLHRFLVRMYGPNVNTVDIQDWMRAPYSMIVMGSSVSVDTFFTISGMLVLLSFFRTMDKNNKIDYRRYFLHRYVRITPAVFVMVLLYATLVYHVSTGPFWESAIGTNRKICEQYWWSSLLYIQNYVNPENYCVVHTWYLSADMQLFWLSPLFLIPLYRKPGLGFMLLAVMIIAPMILSFYLAWINHYDGSLLFQKNLLETKYFARFYTQTHIRASPWFIGLGLGYLVHKFQNEKLVMKKSLVFLLWILTFVILLTVVFGIYPFQQYDHPKMRFHSSSYLAFSRVAWSLAISWIIFASVHGYGDIINQFLSWSVFKVLSKLSYGMYLTHLGMQFLMLATLKNPRYFTVFDDVHATIADVGLAMLASFFLTVGFEMPIHRIEEYLFRSTRVERTS